MKDQLLALAADSPVDAVTEGWRLLESQLSATARTHKLNVAPAVWTMPMVLGALLQKEGFISEAQFDLLRRARTLRNQVTPGLGAEDAESFVKLIVRLAASLQAPLPSAEDGPPDPPSSEGSGETR
jgi:hypothetical protein